MSFKNCEKKLKKHKKKGTQKDKNCRTKKGSDAGRRIFIVGFIVDGRVAMIDSWK